MKKTNVLKEKIYAYYFFKQIKLSIRTVMYFYAHQWRAEAWWCLGRLLD